MLKVSNSRIILLLNEPCALACALDLPIKLSIDVLTKSIYERSRRIFLSLTQTQAVLTCLVGRIQSSCRLTILASSLISNKVQLPHASSLLPTQEVNSSSRHRPDNSTGNNTDNTLSFSDLLPRSKTRHQSNIYSYPDLTCDESSRSTIELPELYAT
jgi:hypothetical protein